MVDMLRVMIAEAHDITHLPRIFSEDVTDLRGEIETLVKGFLHSTPPFVGNFATNM